MVQFARVPFWVPIFDPLPHKRGCPCHTVREPPKPWTVRTVTHDFFLLDFPPALERIDFTTGTMFLFFPGDGFAVGRTESEHPIFCVFPLWAQAGYRPFGS